MPAATVTIGVLLILLGVGSYLGLSPASKTALIPAAFGVVFVLLGAVAVRPTIRKHAMHAAVLLAVLGVAGAFRGVLKLPALLSGGAVERPAAVAAQSIMAALCLLFVILAVRSFIAARRAARPAG